MSETFKKWQNREIDDITCIRQLEQEKTELIEFVKLVYGCTQCSPELFIVYREKLWLKSYELKQKHRGENNDRN